MMSSETFSAFPNKHIDLLKEIDSTNNRLQNMLDWLLSTRESVANMNLELHTLFKPIELSLNKTNDSHNQPTSIDCPLHTDCTTALSKVISNLHKLSKDTEY